MSQDALGASKLASPLGNTMGSLSIQEAPREFGPVSPTPEYVEVLQGLRHQHGSLRKSGYTLEQLAAAELDRKRRCDRCHRQLLKGNHKSASSLMPLAPLAPTIPPSSESPARGTAGSQAGPSNTPPSSKGSRIESSSGIDVDKEIDDLFNYMTPRGEPESPPKAIIRCKYHPGRVAYRKWTCCNGQIFAKPCAGETNHLPCNYLPSELENNWRFYETPKPQANARVSLAVALDCEMGTAESGESELIRISVVDYFSRAILLDSLVFPDTRMAHYNTRFSGVTRQAMNDARRRRTCILGRANARKEIWKFVGPDTIVVGHGASNDMTSLRWIHRNMVDTLLVETRLQPPRPDPNAEEGAAEPDGGVSLVANEEPAAEADSTGGKFIGLSLKALALDRLGRSIQLKGQGHDSLEDSLATRDLLHWHVQNALQAIAH